jgi:hypothetical protein
VTCVTCVVSHLQPAEDVSARQDTSPGGDVQGIQRKLTIRPDNGAELLDEPGVGNDVSFRRSATLQCTENLESREGLHHAPGIV